MAIEMICLDSTTRETVLVTQRCFRLETTKTLENKLSRNLWDPNPAAILTPMPPYYVGRYRYHLYNGNHRDYCAREWGVPLNGLVAHSIDDIPKLEIPNRNMQRTPDFMLRLGLINLIDTVYGAEPSEKSLEELVGELQELEQMLSHEELIAYFR